MCIRDLRVYTQAINGEITFYRDENNFEIDAILRTQSGKWGAIEIKLGSGYVEEAAQNLLKFKNKVDIEIIISSTGLSVEELEKLKMEG